LVGLAHLAWGSIQKGDGVKGRRRYFMVLLTTSVAGGSLELVPNPLFVA
jgi:hypothetical protein